MAGGKQDTRQKMINMMYLVFIAMLALNISKEVLATLGIINQDIEAATQDLVVDSQDKYNNFSNNANNEYYRIAAENTPQIKELADEYFDYIEGLKQYLINSDAEKTAYRRERIAKYTGVVDSITDYQIMDKSQEIDSLFFIGKEYTPSGKEFVDRFEKFPVVIKAVLDTLVAADLEKDPPTEDDLDGLNADFDFSAIDQILNKRFAYSENVLNRDGLELPYLDYHFKGFPKIASLSKFTKIQSDIRYVENKILEYILSVISEHEGGISANTYKTLLESKASYYTNELVDASIVMGKKASEFVPSRVELFIDGKKINEGTDFEIAPGGVKLKKRFGSANSYKLTGKLFYERNKQETAVDVSQVIEVIDKTDDAIISAEQMKVLYQGLPNDLSISIPGIPNNKLRIRRVVNGTVSRKGSNWEAIPDANKVGDKMTIFVSGERNGEPVDSKGQEFRIKPLPPALGSISLGEKEKYASGQKISKGFIDLGIIAAKFPDDFDYPLDVVVTSFKMGVGNRSTISVNGNRIDNEDILVKYIKTLSSGDRISVFDIVAKTTSGNRVIEGIDVTPFTLSVK